MSSRALSLVVLGAVWLAPIDAAGQEPGVPADELSDPSGGGAETSDAPGDEPPPGEAEANELADADGELESGPNEFVDPTAPAGDRMRILVIDAAIIGVDPVVGRVTTTQLRSTAAAMGYEVLSRDQTVAAARSIRMPYPPSEADLWRVGLAARVHRAAFAQVTHADGRYIIEVVVASLDGDGPFRARDASGAADLTSVVDRMLRQSLPPPDVWNQAGAEASGTTEPQTPTQGEGNLNQFDEPEEEEPEDTEPAPELRRWSLTLQTEAAFGASSDFFYNHMIGLRLDFRITRDIPSRRIRRVHEPQRARWPR